MSVTVGDMSDDSPKRGRPPGFLLNPEAAKYALDGRPQSWWATEAEASTAHISEMMAGRKAATPELAQRMADVLRVPVGMLFPELVQFTTQVRHFTAPKYEAA